MWTATSEMTANPSKVTGIYWEKVLKSGKCKAKFVRRFWLGSQQLYNLLNRGNQGIFGTWMSVNAKDFTGEQWREEFGTIMVTIAKYQSPWHPLAGHQRTQSPFRESLKNFKPGFHTGTLFGRKKVPQWHQAYGKGECGWDSKAENSNLLILILLSKCTR